MLCLSGFELSIFSLDFAPVSKRKAFLYTVHIYENFIWKAMQPDAAQWAFNT